MNRGCHTSETPSKSPARFDHAFAQTNEGQWLDRAVAQFLAAISFQIPVGYQDEAGFHCDIKRTVKRSPLASAPGQDFTGPMQF